MEGAFIETYLVLLLFDKVDDVETIPLVGGWGGVHGLRMSRYLSSLHG